MEIRLHRLLGLVLNVPSGSSGSRAEAAAVLAVEHGPDPAGGHSPRVLMVVESCGGGTGRHVFDLVEGLLDREWNVHLIYSPRRADRSFLRRLQATRHLKYAGCPMHRGVHPSDLTALRFVRRYIRDYGPFDIIHGHSSKGGALARLTAIGTAARVVYTPNAFITMDPRLPWRKRMLYRAAEWMLSRLTDRIIAVSPAERRHGVAMGLGPSRVILIPNGIEPAALPTRVAVRRELGLAENELVVGFRRPPRRPEGPGRARAGLRGHRSCGDWMPPGRRRVGAARGPPPRPCRPTRVRGIGSSGWESATERPSCPPSISLPSPAATKVCPAWRWKPSRRDYRS